MVAPWPSRVTGFSFPRPGEGDWRGVGTYSLYTYTCFVVVYSCMISIGGFFKLTTPSLSFAYGFLLKAYGRFFDVSNYGAGCFFVNPKRASKNAKRRWASRLRPPRAMQIMTVTFSLQGRGSWVIMRNVGPKLTKKNGPSFARNKGQTPV